MNKYFAVNINDSQEYSSIDKAIADMKNWIPYKGSAEDIDYDSRVILYSIPNEYIGTDYDEYKSELEPSDIIFEFYDGVIHFNKNNPINRNRASTLDYNKYLNREIKVYTLDGSDGKRYDVKAHSKVEATSLLKKYLHTIKK